jgi:ADP-dependent NAD(P)H-hydrate dehydratase
VPESTRVTRDLLAGWPLPEPGSSKHARGTVVLVGGSSRVPGAMQLAGEGALRAGGGKLQVVTTESVAAQLAVSLPEALVARAPEGPSGDIAAEAADRVVELADAAKAVLLGPGMTSPDAADALLSTVVARLAEQAVVVDALGSAFLTGDLTRLHHLDSNAVLTLNPTEAAILLGRDEEKIADDPLAATVLLARKTRAAVLLGASTKYVADPAGQSWVVHRGGPGLGVSGSGDVQAGIVTGLLARGAEPAQAAVWGAWLHGRSGEVLADRVGPVGFLARELPATVPGLLVEAGGPGSG